MPCCAAIFSHDANLSESQVTQSHIFESYMLTINYKKVPKQKKTGSNINTPHINIYHTCARSLTCLSLKKMLMSGDFMKVIPIQCWCLACGLLPQTPENAIHNQQNIMVFRWTNASYSVWSSFCIHTCLPFYYKSTCLRQEYQLGWLRRRRMTRQNFVWCAIPTDPANRRPSPAALTFGHRRRE